MNNSFGAWADTVPSSSLEDVVNYVLKDHNTDNIKYDLHPTVDYIDTNDYTKSLSILDFGCGICRNAVAIAKVFPHWSIIGYDNIGMFAQADNLHKLKFGSSISTLSNLQLESNWHKIKILKFDMIYAGLVFQHIQEKYLKTYLNDIKLMTKTLLVHGRRYNDDMYDGKHKNTWNILEKNGFYPTICSSKYSVEGLPKEHFSCLYKL